MIGQRDCTTQYDLLPQTVTDDEDEANQRLNRPDNKMSFPRKVAFIVSILFACFVAASFLWLLPCPQSMSPCSHQATENVDYEWTKTFPFTVFRSGLQLVKTEHFVGFLLALQSPYSNSSIARSTGTTGVIFMRASDGHKIWQQNYPGEPRKFFCDRLDVNEDGIADCILIGTNGLFTAVNVTNGYPFWFLHDHLDDFKERSISFLQRPSVLSLPAILEDQTHDNIDELVVSCLLKGHGHWHVIIISGGMGQLLGRPVPLPGCSTASQPVVIENRLVIHCVTRENGTVQSSWVGAMNVSDLINASMDPITVDDKDRHKKITQVFNFEGRSDRFCMEAIDLNGDGNLDLLIGGGNGEFVALNGLNLNVIWKYQRAGHEVVSCNADNRIVTVTLLPVNSSSEYLNSLVVTLKSDSGDQLWIFNNRSLMSSTLIDGKFLPNATVLKSISRTDHRSWKNEATNKEIDEINVVEKLVIIDGNGEVNKEVSLQKNITSCYYFDEQQHPECLPESIFYTSSVVNDVDLDGLMDVISVSTALTNVSGQLKFETNVVKWSIG